MGYRNLSVDWFHRGEPLVGTHIFPNELQLTTIKGCAVEVLSLHLKITLNKPCVVGEEIGEGGETASLLLNLTAVVFLPYIY